MTPSTHASERVLAEMCERFECWNTGELDRMESMYSPEAELDTTAFAPDGRVYRGRDSMRRYWDDTWEVWEGVRMDPLDVIDVGDGRLVVPVRLWGKAKRSGIEVDQRAALLYTLGGDGLITRNQMFADQGAALAAAGA
jgi:ketosteroid isomerase-like protein